MPRQTTTTNPPSTLSRALLEWVLVNIGLDLDIDGDNAVIPLAELARWALSRGDLELKPVKISKTTAKKPPPKVTTQTEKTTVKAEPEPEPKDSSMTGSYPRPTNRSATWWRRS